MKPISILAPLATSLLTLASAKPTIIDGTVAESRP